MTEFQEENQKLSTDPLVELFDLDATVQGSGVFRFYSGAFSDAVLVWRGESYTPLPIEATGWEMSGKGSLPTPTMRISNVHLLMSTIINNIGDPLGAKITRWVTYEKFLDAPIGSEADPDKYRKDLYQIERKVSQDEAMVEFELSAAIDQDGRQLPGRQVVRGFCNHRYRVFTGPTLADPTQIFSYDNATCPYTGDGVAADDGPYFTQSGLSATGGPIEDVCGKKLSDCKLRFTNQPTPLPLPFRGFPAVDRIRVD